MDERVRRYMSHPCVLVLVLVFDPLPTCFWSGVWTWTWFARSHPPDWPWPWPWPWPWSWPHFPPINLLETLRLRRVDLRRLRFLEYGRYTFADLRRSLFLEREPIPLPLPLPLADERLTIVISIVR